jgi:hypothetical protein
MVCKSHVGYTNIIVKFNGWNKIILVNFFEKNAFNYSTTKKFILMI